MGGFNVSEKSFVTNVGSYTENLPNIGMDRVYNSISQQPWLGVVLLFGVSPKAGFSISPRIRSGSDANTVS